VSEYRIRNWAKFQHYKDRNPPWIKLHVEILQSADWVMLDDASKLLAVVCMVIAARENGVLPDNPDYIKRVAYLNKRPNLIPLIDCGFLEKVQANDSESKQPLADARPEKEEETEKSREEKKVSTAPKGARDLLKAEFEAWWTAYPKKVAKGQALKAYIAARKTTCEDVLTAGALRYAADQAGKDAQYTRHPATWLNGQCWLDESTTDIAERERENFEREIRERMNAAA
jgi:hypothetical protein